ncbi:MAG TPA: choice-of-anchor tandem repeat GloVer-containing protein [Candidatus Acidoferrales bacterium]|jgi:uncharacterized repeat protein (TIGR03803 family)|nr:choice-of-anchor tandem repeat GloVer-containing protein [Candidatus Acidoferrales bacterium]
MNRSLWPACVLAVLLAAGCTQHAYAPPLQSTSPSLLQHASGVATYKHLYDFAGGALGWDPYFGPIAVGHLLYGPTGGGGASSKECRHGCGAVYSYDPIKGKYTIVYSFGADADAENPGGLAADAKGNIYGPAAGGTYFVGAVFKLTQSKGRWSEQTIYSFKGGSQGAAPSQFVVDANGSIVGSAQNNSSSGPSCCGEIYQLTPSGSTYTEREVHAFKRTDGQSPDVVTMGPNGVIYGVTLNGGNRINNVCQLNGCGTVFELVPNNGTYAFKTLYKFHGIKDGSFPSGHLAFSPAGKGVPTIYGVTQTGGNGKCENAYGFTGGCGTVYALVPVNGKYPKATLLHQFPAEGYGDGNAPRAGVTLDNGTLYGTTYNSNAPQEANGYGLIFQLGTDGSHYAIVHAFSNASDGETTGASALSQVGNALYGSTIDGGIQKCGTGCGTLYRIAP